MKIEGVCGQWKARGSCALSVQICFFQMSFRYIPHAEEERGANTFKVIQHLEDNRFFDFYSPVETVGTDNAPDFKSGNFVLMHPRQRKGQES